MTTKATSSSNSQSEVSDASAFRGDHGLLGFLREWIPRSPFRGKAFVVGGFVRDRLFGQSVKDLDVVVEEAGGAERLAHALHVAFPELCHNPHQLGRGYPIWSLAFREDFARDGRSFALKGEVLEIADTQSEAFPDPATRQRVTRFGNIDEDCARRDFTVNMLFLDLSDGRVLDPSGRGLEDLRAGRLATHPRVEATKIFSDDPLRMLRLFRFRSRFGWDIAAKAWEAVIATRTRFGILSAERIREEMTKLLVGAHAPAALEDLRRSGLLAEFLPELLAMPDCGQDRHYHAEGDVWVHTLRVVANAPPRPKLRWAALLHDAGKPATRSEHPGERVKFLGHERVSVSIATRIFDRLKIEGELRESVLRLIALHLRGGDALGWKSLKPARKLAREAGDDLPDLLDLIEADSRASLGPDGQARLDHLPILRKALEDASRVPIRARPVLDGRAVMALLGLRPGPELGRVLAELHDFEDETAAEGRALTENEARDWLLSRKRGSE